MLFQIQFCLVCSAMSEILRKLLLIFVRVLLMILVVHDCLSLKFSFEGCTSRLMSQNMSSEISFELNSMVDFLCHQKQRRPLEFLLNMNLDLSRAHLDVF